MFTYVGVSRIFIIVKVNREDERIANNKERTYYFRIDDVYGDGGGHDVLQSLAQWITRQDVPA